MTSCKQTAVEDYPAMPNLPTTDIVEGGWSAAWRTRAAVWALWSDSDRRAGNLAARDIALDGWVSCLRNAREAEDLERAALAADEALEAYRAKHGGGFDGG